MLTVVLLAACAPSSSSRPSVGTSATPTPVPSGPGATDSPGIPAPTATPPEATRVLNAFGIRLAYPATWREFHYEVVSSFSSVIAYLGTVDVQDPCTRTATSITCGRGFTLPPGGVVVVVENHGFPGYDILEHPMDEGRGVLVQVAGLPARRAISGPDADTGADAVVTWSLSHPDAVDNWYMITGYVRGPGALELIDKVDALIASFAYDPPIVPLPSDPNVMRAAVGDAIEQAASGGSVGWDCVPRGPGVVHAMITAIPNGPELPAPVAATCSVTVEPTAHQLWKVTITVVADGAVATNAGDASQILWVAPPPNLAPSPSP